MADPKSGVALVFYTQLVSRSTGQFQASPTIAAGDWKVSADGAALANLATLPSVDPAASTWVKISLSAGENTGTNVNVQGIDAAGAEWNDTGFCIRPTTRTVDDVATPAQVNAEVVDAINVDTYTEPAAVPAATSSLADKIRWLFALGRNKITETATTQLLRNDGDAATIGTATVSDDGVTGVRGKFV